MARVLYTEMVEVAPEAEAQWSAWHSARYVPDVLAQPGFISARKFRDADEGREGWAHYLVHFEVESPEVLEQYLSGTELTKLRQEHAELFGLVTRVSRQIAQEVESFAAPVRIA